MSELPKVNEMMAALERGAPDGLFDWMRRNGIDTRMWFRRYAMTVLAELVEARTAEALHAD